MLFSIKLVLKPTSMKANVTKKLGEKVRAKNSLYTANRHSVKIKQCWKWKKLLTFIIFWTLFQVDESAIFYLDVACVNDDSSCLAHLTLSIVFTIFWKKRVRSESQPCHIYYPYFTSKNETMLHLGVFDRAVVFLTISMKDKHKVASSVLIAAAIRIAITQYVKDNWPVIKEFPKLKSCSLCYKAKTHCCC